MTRDRRIFLVILAISFTVYLFSNDGHRYSIDEDISQRQAIWLVNQEPHPDFIPGESRALFDYPELWPNPTGPKCKIGILCSPAYLGHSLTEYPFIAFNKIFHVISEQNLWSIEDFDNQHYVWWRNSIEPDLTFMELFYGPTFTALSVSIFFLICRSFEINIKNSLIVTLLFGFSTITWAYSQTSLNSVPMTMFVLLGFLLFRKYQEKGSYSYLILSSVSLGVAINIRPDAVFIIIAFILFLFYWVITQIGKNRIRKEIVSIVKPITMFSFITATFYGIFQLINFVRFDTALSYSFTLKYPLEVITPFPISLFGLLFSPGIGLFIFSPIFFLVIVSFTDLYSRNKKDFLFLLGIVLAFLVFYSQFVFYWHGLVGWSARYLLPIVPFLLIPLAATLEKRNSKNLTILLIILGAIGVFFNFTYIIQDVSWFVWGQMGSSDYGLYSLHGGPLRLHPLTIWTFEFSQLTHSIFMMFANLQTDIYLLKLLGVYPFAIILIGTLTPLSYSLIRLSKKTQDLKSHEF